MLINYKEYASVLLKKKPKNDRKWQKMAQWMIVNETGDWNILERTEEKSKGHFVVKNDNKGQSVIMTENDK